jgi:hypothetical protein
MDAFGRQGMMIGVKRRGWREEFKENLPNGFLLVED